MSTPTSDGGGTYYPDYTDRTDVSPTNAHGFYERRLANIEGRKQNWRTIAVPPVDTRIPTQMTAIKQGFDGTQIREPGETFTMPLAVGAPIPDWTVAPGTPNIDALIAAANPDVLSSYRNMPGVKVRA